MRIILSPTAMGHLDFWKRTDARIVGRIRLLLSDISEHPFSGIGKPEPLKGPLRGLWSRRINHEHRLIYKVEDQEVHVYVLSMRYHYLK